MPGLLSLGVNVFGFELDPRQFAALIGLLAVWHVALPSFEACDRQAVFYGARFAKACNVLNVQLGEDDDALKRKAVCASCGESLFERDFEFCGSKKSGCLVAPSAS